MVFSEARSFRRAHLVVLVLLLSARSSLASTPAPSGSADVVLSLDYSPDRSHLPAAAISLVGSASSRIFVASWQLTDPSVVSSLCAASSAGVSVSAAVLLPAATSAAPWVQAARLVASGGTVYSCSFPKRIANNFIVADGNCTALGNYYFSPSAVQAGSYLMVVSGTRSASQAEATFGNLIASGTIVSSWPAGRGRDWRYAAVSGETCDGARYRGSAWTRSAATGGLRSPEAIRVPGYPGPLPSDMPMPRGFTTAEQWSVALGYRETAVRGPRVRRFLLLPRSFVRERRAPKLVIRGTREQRPADSYATGAADSGRH